MATRKPKLPRAASAPPATSAAPADAAATGSTALADPSGASITPGQRKAIVLPAVKPRNRLASDPLLRKSSAHADKRRNRPHVSVAAVQREADDVVANRRRRDADQD